MGGRAGAAKVHVGKSYNLLELLARTRRRANALLVPPGASVAAYELLGLRWLSPPWSAAAIRGTAAGGHEGLRTAGPALIL